MTTRVPEFSYGTAAERIEPNIAAEQSHACEVRRYAGRWLRPTSRVRGDSFEVVRQSRRAR